MSELTATAAVSAATVHEAAGRRGALPSRIKPVDDRMRLHASALTVHLPPGDNLGLHRAIYAAAPGDVLVASTGSGTEFGYWGEILNEAALARGLAGLVIDGGVRDVEALRTSTLPVFSAGICLRGTIKDATSVIELGRTIRIGDVTIRSGDLVVGDVDGVVTIPAGDVPEVLARSAERDRHEQAVISRIRAGESTLAIYGLDPGEER